MITKKIKKRKTFPFFSIILILGFLGAIGLLVVGNWKIGQRRAELTARIESLKKEIAELQKQNEEIQAGLSQKGEEGYLEKEARERLNLKKPGEEVVVVVPPKEEEGTQEEKNFWERWWEIFKEKIKK
jgi:cell division protein FtsB